MKQWFKTEDYTPLALPGVKILDCPSCQSGDANLHHTDVHVFVLDREEDSPGTHVAVTDVVTVDRDLAGNPSGRRHGLTIDFWCEHCYDINRLNIAQHKGFTHVYWSSEPVGTRPFDEEDDPIRLDVPEV